MHGRLIINSSNGNVIAINACYAQTMMERIIGLLNTRLFIPGDALMIRSCHSIHTIGMKYPIDVVFINKFSYVDKTVSFLKPNRLCMSFQGSYSVLELPQGMIRKSRIKPGDMISHYCI